MYRKAESHGLAFNDTINIDGDESEALVHDSFAEMAGGVYRACRLWRPFYRDIGAAPVVIGNRTTTTINETIDATVFDRWHKDSNYRPANLVAWAQAHQLDIDSIHDSVRADVPAILAPALT